MPKHGLFAIVLSVLLCAVAVGETHYVDLSSAANRALEDDGVADNGQGGWSDEGANDMFIYPPLPFGEVTRNAHHFFLPRPTEAKPQTIVMLRSEALADLPERVEVSVPQVRGKYVYFLQNMVRTPRDSRSDTKVAQYIVHYADGSERQVDLIAGQHLRHWWTANWWDNGGTDSWPIFMGRNAYSIKWRQMIGVWAMQWPNPYRDKPITAITLASTGRASPAIFAITIDDADYHADDRIKDNFKRPEDVPAGYFDKKLAVEREHARDEMIRQKMIEGVRRVELIRPDLLAVTIDAWVAGGPGRGEEMAAALQSPERFAVRVNGGPAIHPQRVGRMSYEYWNGDIGPLKQEIVYWHTYYLQLDQPLSQGASCTIKVDGIEDPLTSERTITFNPDTLASRVIKVNQVAYAENAKRRYAYLGWWAGDLGTVNYDQFKSFDVIDDTTGRSVLTGSVALRAADDSLSGERVYEMDLSQLERGRYHIVIDGLARSCSFAVGGDPIDRLYRQTNRAYYHQRAGTKLTKPYTTFSTGLHHHRLTAQRACDRRRRKGR